MKNKTKYIIGSIICVIGVFLTLFGVVCFQQNLLMTFPIGVRMVLMPVAQWVILLVPVAVMILLKINLSAIGLYKNQIGKQILIGLGLALAMSFLFTLIPILAGQKDNIVGEHYQYLWQFLYEFLYLIVGVALMEEIVFRGILDKLLEQIFHNEWVTIIGTSVLFGFYHVFNGNLIQVVFTTFLGLIFSLCKHKIKGCTLLTLIIMHGIYDWLILVWGYFL